MSLPKVELLSEVVGDRIVFRSPAVGFWRSNVIDGQLVGDKAVVGVFEVLGRRSSAVLGAGSSGRVVTVSGAREVERAVEYGEILFELDRGALAVSAASSASESAAGASGAALVFASPSSGRFYSRPDPSKPPFATVGETIEPGAPVCMLEVMKTYSRVRYDGPSARVLAVRPSDGDDLEEGDVILELEPV